MWHLLRYGGVESNINCINLKQIGWTPAQGKYGGECYATYRHAKQSEESKVFPLQAVWVKCWCKLSGKIMMIYRWRIINSMEQNSSWEANMSSATQEILRIL
jgi:hypothetical protein